MTEYKYIDTQLFEQRCNALSIINKFFEEKYFKDLKSDILKRLMIDLRTTNIIYLKQYFQGGIDYIKDETKFKTEQKQVIKNQLIILFNNNSYLKFEEYNIDIIVDYVMNRFYDNFKKEILEIYEIGYKNSLSFS